jgi:hypothetical protein
LQETDFDTSVISNNTIPEKSIANMKRLHTLEIDGFLSSYNEVLATFKLPSLHKLVFVKEKFNPDDFRDVSKI